MVRRFIYNKKAAPYVFILPFILVFLLFFVSPMINTVIMSFQNILPGSRKFVKMENSNRVKIACLAQLFNVIAPIMTKENGPAWKQTIYYPYLHASKYGRGIALEPVISSQKHDTIDFTDVTDVESIAVYNEEEEELTIFAVNRNLEEDITLTCDVKSFKGYKVIEYIVLENNDMKISNSSRNENVVSRNVEISEMNDGILITSLGKTSWNVIRLGK